MLFITQKNFRVPVFTFTVIGSLIFLLLLFIAMIVYNGGHDFDPYFPYYSFPLNYLSDLGRARTLLGEPNWLPRMLFTLALFIGGIGLVVFYLLYPYFFREDRKTYRIALAGTVLGVISSIFCISTALFPIDLYTSLHRACAFILGIVEVPAMILIILAIFREKKYPNFYAWIFLVYVFILFVYILLYASLGFDSPYMKEAAKIIGQKIVIFLQVVNLAIQAYGARKLLLTRYSEQSVEGDQVVT